MGENFSLGGLRKKVDLSQLKGGLKIEQFDLGKNDKLKSVFDKLDANKDGTITAEEMADYIELLRNAAGGDNKLSRKEAKASGLGKRGDINNIIKQAINLSKNMKGEAPTTTTQTPVPTAPIKDVPEAVVEQVIDAVKPESEEEDIEITTQDALKNLFGGKRKASVKIDGTATGLSSRAYQGEVVLPSNETIEDGKFPKTLRITLPASYGANATMKLTLVDEENGIYETSAHDRNFQVVADENGNVSINSVNVEELQGKLNSNLEKYRQAEVAKQAQNAEQPTSTSAAEVPQQISKEELEKAQAQQRQSASIATDMFNACKGSKWNSVEGREFQTALGKINEKNASQVLSAYAAQHPEETFVDMICSEKTSDDDVRKAALKTVMQHLADEAIAKGVPPEEVKKLVNDFNASADSEFDSFGVIDPKKMEVAMKQLHGLVLGKDLKAGDVSTEDAMKSITGAAQGEYDNAKQAFDTAREEEGFMAKLGDDVLGVFGYTTKEDMEAKLGEYAGDVQKLKACKTETEFKTAYKEVFGIDFDSKKVAAYEAAQSEYSVAYGAKQNVDTLNTLYNAGSGLDYDAYKAKVMPALDMSAEEVDAVVDGLATDYMAKHPHSNKTDVLRHFVDNLKQEQMKLYNQTTKGQTLEQMSANVDSVRQAAFGDKDIVNDVIKYNANTQMTGMAVEMAGEIALTAALQAVPGAGQFAAVRLAGQMAKWGSRAAKFAKYMPKTVNTIKNVASGVKNSKVVKTTTNAAAKTADAVKDSNTIKTMTGAAVKVKNATPTGLKEGVAKVVRGTDAAFEGTLIINLADGKSVEDSVKKALQNAAFAGAGATASEIAPFIAKSIGCNTKIAEEMVEHALDVVSSAGISYGVTGGYTSDDALQDILTGVIMNRLGKGFKAKDVPEAKPAPETQDKVQISDNSRDRIADGVVVENADWKHLDAKERKMIEADETPTPQELEAYAKEIAYKPPTAEEQVALDKHQEQVKKDYAEAHEIGNNATIKEQKPSSPAVPKEAIEKLNDELKGINGTIQQLEKQLFGAKKIGKKATVEKLESQIAALKEKQAAKMTEIENLTTPKNAQYEAPEVIVTDEETPKVEVEVKPEIEAPKAEVANVEEAGGFISGAKPVEEFVRPLQNEKFMGFEKISNPSYAVNYLMAKGIEPDITPLGGNGPLKFTLDDNSYQVHYQDGKMSALRLKDADGNKFYYSYDADGNRKSISRNEFIELKENSDLMRDKVLHDFNNVPVNKKINNQTVFVTGSGTTLKLGKTVLDFDEKDFKAHLESLEPNETITIGRMEPHSIIIGPGNRNAYYFNDPTVSAEHLKITKRGNDIYEVTDLSSTNGTVINPEPSRMQKLKNFIKKEF